MMTRLNKKDYRAIQKLPPIIMHRHRGGMNGIMATNAIKDSNGIAHISAYTKDFSYKKLAKRCGMSVSTAKRSIKQLVSLGIIKEAK